LEKTFLIVPALNKHDFRHRFSTRMIAITCGKIWGAERMTGYPDNRLLGSY
jgi:hypothetical protein